MEDASRNPGWWGRNWKWVVPAGVLVLILLLTAAIVLIYLLVVGQIKSSEVHVEALAKVRSDPELAQSYREAYR